ncbi:zinc knuckle CX2CX4HX4C containing protein [Tanacetum coccineum]
MWERTSMLSSTIESSFVQDPSQSGGDQRKEADVSNSSPLVSRSTTINVPRELNSIDVAATFRVSLSTVGDLHKLINDIEADKHDKLLSGMTNDDRIETLDALGSICNSIQKDDPIIDNNLSVMASSNVLNTNDNLDGKASHSNPIVQFVDILKSYVGAAGASAKEQPNVISNFHPLVADPIYDSVNISIPRKVIEKMIHKSPIILKKWVMGTSLQKEELTRIPIWVKLHDVPFQVFEEDGISLIATFIGKPIMLDSYTSSTCKDSWGRSSFARCLIEVNSEADLIDVVSIGIPSLTGDDFTKETIHEHCPKKVVSPPVVTTSNVAAPTIEKSNDGFQTVGKKKKRKGKSTSTNGGQFVGPSVKHTIRYEPKAAPSAPKKGTTNVSNPSTMLKTAKTISKKDNFATSNSFTALNDDEEVKNVYDESDNLFKTGGSSSFTAATDMAPLPPRDQRHLWLRYQVEGYIEEIVHDFKQRLETIFSRQEGQAPEKVTATDLFYLSSMDRGTTNVPYLLAQYLFRHAEGRKSGARLSGGHVIGHLAHHFCLVSDDGLRGLSVVARELPLIDMGELVKLNICMEIGDNWAWVASGLERQQVAVAGAPEVVEDAPAVDEGGQARLGRLEEEVQGLRHNVRTLRGLVKRSMTDQGRFSTWMISCMAQLMEASGQTYQAFDGTFRGSSPTTFQRRTRRRTGEDITSTTQQDPQLPDP